VKTGKPVLLGLFLKSHFQTALGWVCKITTLIYSALLPDQELITLLHYSGLTLPNQSPNLSVTPERGGLFSDRYSFIIFSDHINFSFMSNTFGIFCGFFAAPFILGQQ